MTLKFRRILFFIFFTAFIVITSLTTLYAIGYKINLTWPIKFNQAFQKTGMFIFNTEPNGAKIYLNDKPRQLIFKKLISEEKSYITTAAKIKNLLPGEYEVRLELDGFWPWQKKLTIYPGQSTFAEDINLFKKSLPLQIDDFPIQDIVFSPNKKYIYIPSKLLLINLDNSEHISFPFNSQEKNSSNKSTWSPDSNKIIADNKVININNINNEINLNNLTSSKIENIKWANNSSKLYYQHDNSISYFEINTKISNILVEGENYLDYLIKDSYIFFVSYLNRATKLKTNLINNNELIRELEIPYSSRYKLLNINHKYLNLYDPKHQILYLISPLSSINPLVDVINNVKSMQWINDNKLLYSNDFEIWLYDLNNHKKTILTRISEPITGIIWHPSNNYVIYSTDKSINIIELDEREKRNITELICLDKISSLNLSQKGDILYFMAKIGNQEGLYKLAIQ
ncbi:MAG: hypothetical protein ABIE43_00180 [Patescibacteria group bacterium]